MPKKYLIYRDGDSFIFEATNENGEYVVEESVSNYYQIIEEFIKSGYTVTYDNNEYIVLKSKKGKNFTTLHISVDERIFKSKYFKPLKDDIKRVKKAKGYTEITIENGKRISTRHFGGLLKKAQDHAAIVGITITLVGFIIMYGLYTTTHTLIQNEADKKPGNNKDKYTVSMAGDSDKTPPLNDSEISMFNEKTPIPWNITENGFQIFPFQKSFLIDDDYFKSIIAQNEDNKETDKESEPESSQEIVMSDPIEVEYNNYLNIYAEYFHLDSEKVIEFAKMVTNNYTIPFEQVNGTTAYNIDNKEAACLVFVHNLNKDNLAAPLQDYGLTQSYFVLDPSITTLPADKILSNGQTFEEFFGHICDLLMLDKHWTLGITYLETGRLGSNIAQTKNNFGGMRGKDGFFTYITPEAGIIAHCRNLKRYESLGLNNIYELAGKYVFGNQGLIYEIEEGLAADPENEQLLAYKQSLDNWTSSVKWFRNDFLSRSAEVFGEVQEENLVEVPSR